MELIRRTFIIVFTRIFFMQKEVIFTVSGLFFLTLGLFLLVNTETSITGAIVGTALPTSTSALYGILSLLTSLVLLNKTKTLDDKVEEEHDWKKYDIKKESYLMDIEQDYLRDSQRVHRTPIQERIEQSVTGGKLIQEGRHNRQSTYEEQFHEGHAAQGGRIIDVAGHLGTYGKHKGDLLHFGKAPKSRYLWIVDEDGNFLIANRQVMHHDLPSMKQEKIDLGHRRHKLPHATVARGKKIFGSGEVFVEGGKVKSFNTASGHYVDLHNIEQFNKQGEEVFRYFIRKIGWNEAGGKATYRGYSE